MPNYWERAVQAALWKRRLRKRCCVTAPNFTPERWYECDVFAVTRAGYFHEYEIKRTPADFRADRMKLTKHHLLAKHSTHGPVSFWYVIGQDIDLGSEVVPEWAGVILFTEPQSRAYGTLSIVRKAPRLHRAKVDVQSVIDAQRSLYYRYWSLSLDEVRRLKRPPNSLDTGGGAR